ncbi:MAG: pyruvate kinase alpha/beta domain-containing protein [Candidatus Thorarchaeota archaeon]
MIETIHFKKASSEHTDAVFAAVRQVLKSAKSIEHIVVATTGGETGSAAVKAFSDKKIIVVTHMTGYKEPNQNEITEENREAILSSGAQLLTTTHAFAGVSRGIRQSLGTWTATELVAIAFKTFGQGTKVCAEIALMAADAGLVPVDQDVICIGGTGRGADTAWIVRPANTNYYPQLRMKACICKPMEF